MQKKTAKISLLQNYFVKSNFKFIIKLKKKLSKIRYFMANKNCLFLLGNIVKTIFFF